ncbi:probable pectin methylesterase CGR2 [Zingiber officinale]|uniref:probable pectin methylesterase CGR2 n=1 Tax=Zingiber officinale TaxID=94328 RepID=UPI001C4BABAE|nr:probable pectin methylesterase CGR2 [Zingiber officinale]
MASRRAINPSRRVAESGSIPLSSSLHQKSRTSPLLPLGWLLVAAFLLIGYSLRGLGGFAGQKEAISIGQGVSCSADAIRAIPILKKAYGDSMRKVLHVGLDSCAVVSNLLKEKDTEAWGVEPYDLEDADSSCKSLVRKGFVRSADIKFPLPYRPKSFSLVVISDSLDYLSSKYLNKTLPDIARVSSGGLVIFAGSPGQQRAKILEPAQIGRPAKLRSSSSWVRYFIQTGLEENEMAIKKFEQASRKSSYEPSCQIFHLGS